MRGESEAAAVDGDGCRESLRAALRRTQVEP